MVHGRRRCIASAWSCQPMASSKPNSGYLPRIGSRVHYLLRQITRVGAEGSSTGLLVNADFVEVEPFVET